jgi:hypothetical protein
MIVISSDAGVVYQGAQARASTSYEHGEKDQNGLIRSMNELRPNL